MQSPASDHQDQGYSDSPEYHSSSQVKNEGTSPVLLQSGAGNPTNFGSNMTAAFDFDHMKYDESSSAFNSPFTLLQVSDNAYLSASDAHNYNLGKQFQYQGSHGRPYGDVLPSNQNFHAGGIFDQSMPHQNVYNSHSSLPAARSQFVPAAPSPLRPIKFNQAFAYGENATTSESNSSQSRRQVIGSNASGHQAILNSTSQPNQNLLTTSLMPYTIPSTSTDVVQQNLTISQPNTLASKLDWHKLNPQDIFYGPYQGIFQDWAAAKSYLYRPRWKPSPPDGDMIPSTWDEKLYYILEIYNAMVDFTQFQDKTETKNKINRVVAQKYSQHELEGRAIEVIEEAIKLHVEGCRLMACNDPTCEPLTTGKHGTPGEGDKGFKAKSKADEDRNLDFISRIQEIKLTLKESKAACSDVLDGPKMLQVIVAPKLARKTKAENALNNRKKQKQLEAGSKALGEAQSKDLVEAKPESKSSGIKRVHPYDHYNQHHDYGVGQVNKRIHNSDSPNLFPS